MEIVSVDITNCMFFVVRVYQLRCFSYDLWGDNFCVLRVYEPLYSSYDLRWLHLVCFTFLPAALLNLRPPGAPSFVARRKIEEKGVQRGLRPPLIPRS